MDALLPRLAPASRPEALPESYWDKDKGALNMDALAPVLAPGVSKAEEIDWTLPANLDPDNPDTVWEISKDDPMVQAMGGVFAEHGLKQPVISALAAAYAKHSVSQIAEMRNALKAEEAKLGEKAQERIAGAQKYVENVLVKAAGGDPKKVEAAKARATAFRNTWTTAEQIEVIEALAKAGSEPQPANLNPGDGGSQSAGRVFYAGMEKAN